MATLKDVADRAGVSVRTVSNVVNDWPHVRPELRAKVQAVIDEVGYEPNLAARYLRSGKTGMVALVLPEIDVPYFAELTRCLIDAFSARGLTVVIEQTDGKLERERELISRGARASLFDGIIFSPLEMTSAEIELRRSTIPLVLLGEQGAGLLDHVVIDNIAAAQAATQHLIEIGRRRIAVVGAQPPSLNTANLRVEGYKAALRAANVPFDPDLVIHTAGFHRADGAKATQQLLDGSVQRPDAIFFLNDLLALGGLRTLLQAGIQIPQEVALIGFDDIEEGRFSTPSLSSVSPDKPEIARRAARLLLARIDGEDRAAIDEVVDFELVIRESTGK